MMFFVRQQVRVIAHDRRGHGRSTQRPRVTTWTPTPRRRGGGHRARVEGRDPHRALDRRRRGDPLRRAKFATVVASKAVLISAIPPLFMKTDKHPEGVPMNVIDGIRQGTAERRAQFYQDITMPFYGFNRPGAVVSKGFALTGGAKG